MANRLKIYACSGIGQTEQGTWNYWLDNTETVNNTQAVNTLLALINRNYIEVTRLRGMSDADKIANLNDIDVYVLCLHAAQKLNRTWKQLENAGYVINSMLERGDFNCDSLDNTERDAHLDLLFDKFEQGINEDIQAAESDFMIWYRQNVIERNKNGLTEKQRTAIKNTLKKPISGIGINPDWQKNKDLQEYLLNGGTYFLYTYLTDAQMNQIPSRNKRIFKAKKEKQLKTYNYCKSLFVDIYGSEEEMKEIIRAGIINEFKETPEQICAGFVKGEKPVGFVFLGLAGAAAVKALIEVLSVVCTLLAAIITAICKCVADTNVAKYGRLDQDIVNTSVPIPDDIEGLENTGLNKSKNNSWITWAIAGVGALLVLKNLKK